jgi:hypothetical protein
MPHEPQMPSRQSESNAIGSRPLANQRVVDDVQHLQEGHVGVHVVDRVVDEPPRRIRSRLAPDLQMNAHVMNSLKATGCRLQAAGLTGATAVRPFGNPQSGFVPRSTLRVAIGAAAAGGASGIASL